jgi:NAD(P)-dependent dehydrogenase (short-subunit alcohol dehydrogenase family)
MGGYQTAKFAVEGFSEVLSNEVRPLGIKVTIVEPGAFRTDWGRFVDAHAAGQQGLRGDGGRDEPLPPGGGWPAAG